MKNNQLVFNIYGYKVLIQSELFISENLKAAIDFQHFNEQKNYNFYHLKIDLQSLDIPQTSGLYIGKTKMCRIRQKSFNCRQLEYIHNNKTIAVVDDDTSGKTRLLTIKAINLDVIDDILYFFLNSSAGEYLEYNGMMRLHALSFQISDGAALVHGAPGFGKSTLALELVKNPTIKLFSDEIALFNLRSKMIHPYPLRIASVESLSPETPAQNIKFVYFFNKKSLVNIEKNKIASPKPLQSIFQILNLASNAATRSEMNLEQKIKLSYEIILGIGLIQMWEYLLRLNNLHIVLVILINRIKLIYYIMRVKSFSLNKNSSLESKINSLLQT